MKILLILADCNVPTASLQYWGCALMSWPRKSTRSSIPLSHRALTVCKTWTDSHRVNHRCSKHSGAAPWKPAHLVSGVWRIDVDFYSLEISAQPLFQLRWSKLNIWNKQIHLTESYFCKFCPFFLLLCFFSEFCLEVLLCSDRHALFLTSLAKGRSCGAFVPFCLIKISECLSRHTLIPLSVICLKSCTFRMMSLVTCDPALEFPDVCSLFKVTTRVLN